MYNEKFRRSTTFGGVECCSNYMTSHHTLLCGEDSVSADSWVSVNSSGNERSKVYNT